MKKEYGNKAAHPGKIKKESPYKDDDSELISIYYGEDIKEEDANALSKKLEEKYPDLDVELNYGGQPIYYYILSVE